MNLIDRMLYSMAVTTCMLTPIVSEDDAPKVKQGLARCTNCNAVLDAKVCSRCGERYKRRRK